MDESGGKRLAANTMTTSVNASLTEAQQVFKDLIWTPMLLAGENWLELEVPALNLPVIKQIDEGAIRVVSDYIYAQLCLLIDIEAIRLINSAHQSAYDKASLQLKIIIAEKGTTSDDYKNALAAASTALSKFVRFSQ